MGEVDHREAKLRLSAARRVVAEQERGAVERVLALRGEPVREARDTLERGAAHPRRVEEAGEHGGERAAVRSVVAPRELRAGETRRVGDGGEGREHS